MSRKPRESSKTRVYHVMVRGINKQQIFYEDEDCAAFLRILTEVKNICSFKIHSYCLMGNHVHILVEEKDPGTLDTFMKRITVRFVYWYNRKYERSGHLFQDRFKSEAVEDAKYFCTVVRYIHRNPLKAGLVQKLDEYKYSSYADIINDKKGLVDTELIYSYIPRDRFEEFCNMETSDVCLDVPEYNEVKMPDAKVLEMIKKKTRCQSVSEFQQLGADKKAECYKKLLESGASLRQISRLTGEGIGAIRYKTK